MFLFLIFTALISTASCDLSKLYEYCSPNQKLCEIPSWHALCPDSASALSEDCLPYVIEPLSPNDKAYILSLHNKLRNRVATGNEKNEFGHFPHASNMLKLRWEVELETIAGRWADRCLNASIAGNYADCTNKKYIVAQNIGIIGSKGIVDEKRIFRVFYAWYSKNKFFKFNSIDNLPPDDRDEAKEYINLIWADTSAIGCSRVVFLNNQSNSQQGQGMVPWTFEKILCNYVPGGNIPGRSVYKRGAPCSDCPVGMKCSAEFPGLCSSGDTVTGDNIKGLMTTFTPSAAPQQESAVAEAITSLAAEETSKLYPSNVDMSESGTAVTETEAGDRYSTQSSSQIPINETRGTRTESPKLLVKTGIYFNGKCHCPDISRFGPNSGKTLPPEFTQKLKNQVPATRENSGKGEAVHEGRSNSQLKQGDPCYCKKSTSNGSNKSIPSRFLFCIYIFYFIKLLYYIQ